MNSLLGPSQDTGGVQFWHNAECEGWLEKQGTWLRSWRRRWFVLKDGKMIWFKTNLVTPNAQPRGVIEVSSCLAIKGAEDSSVCSGKAHAFEISIQGSGSQFFIAPSTQEKEAWINAVGQAIVRQSRSALREEYTDYNTGM